MRGVKVSSHGPNSDGCDPESSKNVLIENCIFDTGDDCIAIESGRNADGRKWNVPSEKDVYKRQVVYIAANLAVFGVINTIEQHTHGKIEREDYNGLYKTNPQLTMVMTLALFSLAGIPPFPDSSVSSLYSWQHSIVDIILLYLSH